MSRRTEAVKACRAREPQYRFRAREIGSTHLITPDETSRPLRSELQRGGRAGRGLGELEDQAGLEPRGVRADRVLVELVDRVDLVGAAVELLRDLVEALGRLHAVLRALVDGRQRRGGGLRAGAGAGGRCRG